MGNPLSGLLAEIFIQHIEDNHISNILQSHNIKCYSRYVDDTFIIYENEKTNEQILQSFNKLHNNLKFLQEIEVNNTIHFLDITTIKQKNKSGFNIYRKSGSTNHSIPITSEHQNSHKLNNFKFFINRLIQTPLSKNNYNKEYNKIIQIPNENGYNRSLIKELIHKKERIVKQKSKYRYIKKC